MNKLPREERKYEDICKYQKKWAALMVVWLICALFALLGGFGIKAAVAYVAMAGFCVINIAGQEGFKSLYRRTETDEQYERGKHIGWGELELLVMPTLFAIGILVVELYMLFLKVMTWLGFW